MRTRSTSSKTNKPGKTKQPKVRARNQKRDVDIALRRRPKAGHSEARAGERVTEPEYDWTPERDQLLRDRFDGKRGTLGQIATELKWPFHVVKARAKVLGLVVPTRRRSQEPATATAPIEDTATATDAGESSTAPLRHAKCPRCYTRAQWDPSDSAEELLQQGFTRGFDDDLPVCPNCRTTMVSAEPVDAPEAVRQVAAAAGQQPRLWPDPPFNYEGAYISLDKKDDEIDELQALMESQLRAVKRTRKEITELSKTRRELRQDLKKRLLQKRREALQRQDPEPETIAPDAAICLFEIDTEKPCRICRAESPLLVTVLVGAPVDAWHDRSSDAHKVAAMTANSRALESLSAFDATPVAEALGLGGLHGVDEDIVSTWSDEARRAALAWIEAGKPDDNRPAIVGVPHVASKPGDTGQHCSACGGVLVSARELEQEGTVTYPVAELVGTNCPGMEDRAADTDTRIDQFDDIPL